MPLSHYYQLRSVVFFPVCIGLSLPPPPPPAHTVAPLVPIFLMKMNLTGLPGWLYGGSKKKTDEKLYTHALSYTRSAISDVSVLLMVLQGLSLTSDFCYYSNLQADGRFKTQLWIKSLKCSVWLNTETSHHKWCCIGSFYLYIIKPMAVILSLMKQHMKMQFVSFMN